MEISFTHVSGLAACRPCLFICGYKIQEYCFMELIHLYLLPITLLGVQRDHFYPAILKRLYIE